MTVWLLPLLSIGIALAQESQPALTPLEKDFEQSMSGVTLVGHYSREGASGLSDDKYTIEKVTKVNDDMWRFDTRVQYGSNDLKLPVRVHVKWAGDTPVIELTDESVMGMGTFTARIVIYRGHYAGTWSSANGHGGKMFGDIVKSAK
jgi:hypothetical protein